MTGPIGAKIGEFLIAEGISDAIYIAAAGYNGNLSLKDYGSNKMVSMTLSIAMGAFKFAKNTYKAVNAAKAAKAAG